MAANLQNALTEEVLLVASNYTSCSCRLCWHHRHKRCRLYFIKGKGAARAMGESAGKGNTGRGGARGRPLLVKALAPLQLPVQLPFCRILQDEVHPRLPGIKCQDRASRTS